MRCVLQFENGYYIYFNQWVGCSGVGEIGFVLLCLVCVWVAIREVVEWCGLLGRYGLGYAGEIAVGEIGLPSRSMRRVGLGIWCGIAGRWCADG